MRPMALWLTAAGLAISLEASAGSPRAAPHQGAVNLNNATPAQLQQLPGMSPAAVQAIICYRQAKKFIRISQLAEVRGMSPARVEALRPFLTVYGPTDLTWQPARVR